ncbi:hypothetical protein M407DRAFT_21651 [Tulasnella calospora MUT 4182]|uniref:F-box domain-containing protein n=1 Tax=Tulasnella calospora MUT 4182 TaxID=1051891 RepID=A0A0C3QPI5_9AGAM|nr:hypothetical protein M407DRAFT_21651 [Tulasnella calospora MUT 4182]
MSLLFSKALRDLVWQRSRSLPLDAEFMRDRDNSHWSSVAQPWKEEEKAYLQRVMERGTRELYMQLPRGVDPSPYITNVSHPRLSKLYIYRFDSFIISSPLVAPQLTDLHLVSCSFPWDGLTKLRSLILDGTSCPTLVQLVQALNASPFLEELQLTSLRTTPSDQLLEDDVPQGRLNVAYLTVLVLECIPCGVTAGLLDRLVTSSHCRTSVDVDVGVTLACPYSVSKSDGFVVPSEIKTLLALRNHASDEEDQDTGPSRSSQLVRLFLTEIEGPSFKESIDEARMWTDTLLSSIDGIEIMDHFFPYTRRLDITAEVVLDGVVRALTGTETATGSLSRWRLPKLSELEIKLYRGGHDGAYDGLIDMAIKRTQKAALPQLTVSPITKLRLGRGSVQPESLGRLDEMGIEYILQHVTITRLTTRAFSSDEYFLDDLL